MGKGQIDINETLEQGYSIAAISRQIELQEAQNELGGGGKPPFDPKKLFKSKKDWMPKSIQGGFSWPTTKDPGYAVTIMDLRYMDARDTPIYLNMDFVESANPDVVSLQRNCLHTRGPSAGSATDPTV